ncbi:hypothetical protein AB0J52_10975 [Spirillospora sp. NPDC049652]
MIFQRHRARTIALTAFPPSLAAAALTTTLTAPATATGAETASCRAGALSQFGACVTPVSPARAASSPVTSTTRRAHRATRLNECWCWRFLRPEGLTGESSLTGISAPSAKSGWAVGRLGSAPLALRWTGTRWRRTPLPLPDGTRLSAVSAGSAHDAWIVGSSADGTARTAHWNGRHWTPSALPGAGGRPILANHVAVRARSDVWAVGSSNGFAGTMAVAWHFDGRKWTVTPTRSAPGSTLNAVAADAPNDAWAVGSGGNGQLLLHWTGRSWTPTAPPRSAPSGPLSGVVALAPDNVWAVGSGPSGAPFVEHWDGRGWALVPTPLSGPPGGRTASPQGTDGTAAIVSDGARGVWISGTGAGSRHYLAHYDGAAWDVSRPPLPGASAGASASISALTRVPGTREVRAAGAVGRADGSPPTALTWTNTPRPR